MSDRTQQPSFPLFLSLSATHLGPASKAAEVLSAIYNILTRHTPALVASLNETRMGLEVC